MNLSGEIQGDKMSENKIKWHPYPQEMPSLDDIYLVTINNGSPSVTTALWSMQDGGFKEFNEYMTAWAESPDRIRRIRQWLR